MIKDNREYGIDLIKVLAIFLVILVHGLSSSQLLLSPINSSVAIIALLLRIISMINIPLFFISMGYLNNKYEFNLKYINRFKPIVISYLLAVLFTIITESFFGVNELTVQVVIGEFFDMNVSNYAWYARMYFMFFWMIPFLNKWFNSMDSKNEIRCFLMVLSSIVALPALSNPIFKELGLNISLPTYFVQMYPLLYYFIGMYIKKFPVEIKKTKLITMSTFIVIIQLFVYIIRFKDTQPNLNTFGSYGSLINVVLASCVFLYCKGITIKRIFLKKKLIYVSNHTFDIYLISHIFDRRIYPIFNRIIHNLDGRLLTLVFPMLLTIFGSLIYVYLKDFLTKRIEQTKKT